VQAASIRGAETLECVLSPRRFERLFDYVPASHESRLGRQLTCERCHGGQHRRLSMKPAGWPWRTASKMGPACINRAPEGLYDDTDGKRALIRQARA